jgi:hypothetical protein
MDEPIDQRSECPERLLNALRDHPEWGEDERARILDDLVASFPPERLLIAIRPRLKDLSGGDAAAILQLVEAFGTTDLLEELARAVSVQPYLPTDRAWEALALLDGAGLLDVSPELAERFGELEEMLEDGENTIEEFARHLEEDPNGAWVAVQGLAEIEPDVRAEILSDLERRGQEAELAEFWRLIHQPEVEATALAPWSGTTAGRLQGSLISSLDELGQGWVALVTSSEGDLTAAAFRCDVVHGVQEVVGRARLDDASAGAFLAELAERPERDVVRDTHAAAVALLAGSLVLNGDSPPGTVREWVELTLGREFEPRPLATVSPVQDLAAIPPSKLADWSRVVLDTCARWRDDSELTYDLAEELLLQGMDPNPERAAGAYRFLFENRLVGRLELDRRMLFWMTVFWGAGGHANLARSALTLAWHLSDPQYAVPGHPFLVELATRSLALAQSNLRRGIDLRDRTQRAAAVPTDRP